MLLRCGPQQTTRQQKLPARLLKRRTPSLCCTLNLISSFSRLSAYEKITTNRAPNKQVSLLSWRLQSGRLATAFLARTAIAASIAVPGTAVRTAMGPATVQLVREDGVAVVVTGGAGTAMGVATGAVLLPSSSSGDRVRWGAWRHGGSLVMLSCALTSLPLDVAHVVYLAGRLLLWSTIAEGGGWLGLESHAEWNRAARVVQVSVNRNQRPFSSCSRALNESFVVHYFVRVSI